MPKTKWYLHSSGRSLTGKQYHDLVHWVMRSRSLTWGQAARAVKQQFGKPKRRDWKYYY